MARDEGSAREAGLQPAHLKQRPSLVDYVARHDTGLTRPAPGFAMRLKSGHAPYYFLPIPV